MDQENMQHVQKRLNRYWYVDGISEIGFGLLCLILGLYFYVLRNLDESSLAFQLLSVGFVLIVLASAFGINRFVSYLKNRITYPRTGFVAYRRVRSHWRLLIGALVGLMSAAMMILITRIPANLDWKPFITGIMFTLVALYFAFRIGLLRYVIIAIAAFLLAVYLAIKSPGDYSGLAAFYFFLGSLICATGVIILWRYVITNQTPTEDQEYE
jgi:hypothetical protein